jgi:hypothetical protein
MNRTSVVAVCTAYVALAASAARAVVYNMPPDALPATLLAGDTLNFNTGGVIPEFAAVEAGLGSTVNLYGGALGFITNLKGVLNVYGGKASETTHGDGATINVFAGTTGGFNLKNSVLNVQGGTLGGLVSAANSTINLAAGQLGFWYFSDTTVNMTGGQLPVVVFDEGGGRRILNVSGGELGHMTLRDGSVLNLRGGKSMPNTTFAVLPDAKAHLYVRSASINGSPVPGLTLGVDVPIDVTNQTGKLDVVLQNGSPFSFLLSTTTQLQDQFLGPLISTNRSMSSTSPAPAKVEVVLTLVPEPCSAALATASIAACVGGLRRRRLH